MTTLIFEVLMENMITFIRMWLFLQKNNVALLIWEKPIFENEAACAFTIVRIYFTPKI